MRLTSSIAACLAGVAVTAVIVVAVHGQQPTSVATSTIFLVPVAGHQHTDTLALGSSPSAVGVHSGTKPKAAPQHTAPASRAPGPVVIGSYQQSLINRDRASAGLGPLTWNSCLASVAGANAVRLSHQGWVQPYHTNGPSLDLGCRLGNQAGENVGWWSGGVNDPQLNTMFMNSPEHRANIMGPYRYVATAWATAPNGAAYIAVEFS
jgi:cysteine-rich secretory family protein